MKVSIHQPQYIPWVNYFLKIAESDVFIFLDSVDFQKNGLQNRNQVKTSQGSLWLTVPVYQKLGLKIQEIEIDNKLDWKKKHWNTIYLNYKKAPCFSIYADELEGVFKQEWTSLSELNMHLLRLMLKWMEIDVRIIKSSELDVEGKASELILNLCRKVGANRYISGTGGKKYLDEDSFKNSNIELVYQESKFPSSYPQQYIKAGFLNDLSACDIILNCGKDWRKYYGY